jgi:uncharacterized protein CbrC (UPF0167 family)
LKFDKKNAALLAAGLCDNDDERSLIPSFVEVCSFLAEFPNELSWRTSKVSPVKPNVKTDEGLAALANRYFEAYRRSDFPVEPSTVPDDMVSVIMEKAYGYSAEECQKIKLEHQHAMCAENCVGNLLERYLDSKLRQSHWSWCCGEFVKAIDFLGKNQDGEWIALQIKNRDNSENSSSSAIRDGTRIQKWFRSFSKDTKNGRPSFTNWEKLPSLMQGYDLNEDDFKLFVSSYIESKKPKI